jgi:uncharacterized membrane protein (UPF0127 family)
MIKLKIGRTRLRPDIEEDNKNKIKRRFLDTKNRIAIILKFNPEHEVVRTILDAVKRNVIELKTDNVAILNLSTLIEKKFSIRIVNAIKS